MRAPLNRQVAVTVTGIGVVVDFWSSLYWIRPSPSCV
ncbi:hypothetical protein RCH16_001528 [Cryobacterium sp. MP_M5]|nr:hypothetical protein [Cryobacterium sp. MP_M3]MEC5176520.1 hypothetical protein [Cryobacterium sp. MP_M5]